MPDSITCLDDVLVAARLAKRQQFLLQWYKAVALAPFALVVFTGLKFFPNSNSRAFDALVFVTLAWAMAVAGYTFYLLFWLKCPKCKYRFGSGEKCQSCNLPRHRASSGIFAANS
jgi:hypothetical protein